MIKNKIIVIMLLLASIVSAETKYAYSYIPKQVYGTQVFPVTIIADTNISSSSPEFTFSGGSSVPVNSTPTKDINGVNTFYTFYFKAFKSDFKTPLVTIVDGKTKTELDGKYIPVRDINTTGHSDFCGLIATDCKLITSQVSTFDGKNNIISITIKASEANPREMFIENAIEYGIEKIKRNGSWVTVEYYFVLPSSIKSITASYYNSIQHRFISKNIVTDFRLNPVAAQESLNPIDSSFDKIKKYGMVLVSLFLLLLYLWRYDRFYLVLLIFSIFVLTYIFYPKKNICVQEGSMLYILPSSTSTTGGIIEKEFTAQVLTTRGIYSKIEYQNGKIGWIRDEDLCKD